MSKSALQQAPAETFTITDRPANDARPSESLVALTHDDLLRETLTAVAPEHVLSFATDEADLTQHLRAEPAGVAFLDAAALKVSAPELAERLRGQFPDLVLIVAGGPEDQSALSHHVTNGTVYRFLHKPVSAQRVKLFVDAAWRRHDVEHAATGTFAQLEVASPLKRRFLRHAPWIGLTALALGLALGLGLYLRHSVSRPGTAAAPAAKATSTLQLLARADAALARGALIAPPAENAADLYREVLRRDATNAQAHAGLERTADALLTAAEQSLLDTRLDEAKRLTNAARAIDPQNVRIAFLTAQIAKELGPQLPAGSGEAAGRAAGAHGSAARGGSPGAAPAEGSGTLDRAGVTARVSAFLKQADVRLRSGALLSPAENNAKFFIDAAAALAPQEAAVRKAQRSLAERLLAEARSAAQSGNVADGERWAQAAADMGARPEELATVRRSLEDARAAANAGTLERIANLFNQRLAQGRLLTPPTDSARFYLAQLESTDPTHPSTVLARTALAGRLLDESRRALAANDWAKAQDWLTEARVVGVSAADATALEQGIAVARDNAGASALMPETTLKKVYYVEPVYPPVAEQLGRSGVVEMQFTVEPDGTVAGIHVTHADPPGMFETAAIAAVRKWRYEPVERGGRAVPQRVTLRVVFKP